MPDLLLITDTLAFCSGLLCVGLWVKSHKSTQSIPHPPGPPGLPIIGNVLDMPGEEEWVQAQKWAEKYGDLVYVEKFGTPFLFVNSAEAADELFEKRGHIYSSRPNLPMINLSGWTWLAGIMPYGDELRKTRILIHQFFQPSVVEEYFDLHTYSAHRLLARLSRDPEGFSKYTRQFAGEQIMKIAYGHDVSEENDPFIELAEKGLVCLGEAQRFYLVNVLPFLQYLPKWFPGAGFLRFAEYSHKLSSDMMNVPYAEVKRQVLEGIASPSMARKFIEAHIAEKGTEEDEEIIKKALGVVYVAGADTTVSVLQTFFLAMVLYPEIQKKAQNELDNVLGDGCLPTFKDRQSLPYINAIVNEALRWQAVTPLAILRTTTEDDIYKGFHIPAGTIICPNVWGMLRNPKEYKDPEIFNPERWLQDIPPTDANKFAFGFGRRICPGKYFAENSVFIAVASILALFIIEKARDEREEPITPRAEYEPSHVRHPKPFRCRTIVRPNKAELLTIFIDTVSLNSGGGISERLIHGRS